MAAAKPARARSGAPGRSLSEALPLTEGALAVQLLDRVRRAGQGGLIHVAGTEGRAERLAAILWALAAGVEAYLLPPWDCLPYDRSSPSARIMGLRVATLIALAAGPKRPWLVLTTAEALVQRLPPRELWAGVGTSLSVGGPVDPDGLARHLLRLGYRADEVVDEPGEFALRGAVIDVFPAGYYLPVRIDHEGGRVTALASFDAASQRSTDAFSRLDLRPVSEAVAVNGEDDAAPEPRPPGLEHRLPLLYERLDGLLDYAPDATLVIEPEAVLRAAAFAEQIAEAYESRLRFGGDEARPLAPGRLYAEREEREAVLARRSLVRLTGKDDAGEPEVPVFARAARPADALRRFAGSERQAGRRLVVAGPHEGDRGAVARRVAQALGGPSAGVASWDELLRAPPDQVSVWAAPVAAGFRADPDVTVLATADVLGSLAHRTSADRGAAETPFDGDGSFRIGDAVVHLDHGIGRLAGVETVATPDGQAVDTIRLEYGGDAKLMVPVGDVELMWRYGAMRDGLTLDRLGSESWPKRRAKVELEINETAAALARLAASREQSDAARLVPPRPGYERFVAGFPYTDTPDQHAAGAAILADLGSGRPMSRLVCGDVGFGKTEVALRAAAAAVLAGKQVAVAAPTTVLVRQHLATFARRFAAIGIEVAQLSRLLKPAEARQVKAGLKDGRIRLVVGTQALAARDVAFADLGLLVVDEEQRFGSADKDKLKRLGENAHVLTLTATPIPRTLQAALAGLQAVSLLATPPAERVPVRTFTGPLDEATLRDALLRETRRGGQSFVVCPRIEDIEPMLARLARLAPRLRTLVAHGKLKAEEIDDVMVRFAEGDGDVLLATNIVESGLDVPRANTIVVWRADRFGLAQLHQLRGRVGRGRLRGVAYLVTDPEAMITGSTRKRLETLASLDRLGAGFEVSAEDLETRGAGDLLGDAQAGHVKLIGAGLYRRLLERALAIARGETPPGEWVPELNVGASGLIPADYVPEADVRIELYARIARVADDDGEARLADEIEDRFGPLPETVRDLVDLARLRRLCRAAAVARVDAGPQAVALSFVQGMPSIDELEGLAGLCDGALAPKGERLVVGRETADGERLAFVEAVLRALPA